jgi:hypothetical protein
LDLRVLEPVKVVSPCALIWRSRDKVDRMLSTDLDEVNVGLIQKIDV